LVLTCPGYLFRATSGGVMRVAGLAPVQVPTIENVNVTELVPGHMAYRAVMPKLLREVGWIVESDEFAEIEDPDPDNHELRQRELINEIEEARRDLEKKAQEKEKRGSKLSWWKKKKAAKNDWEVYDEHSNAAPPGHKKLDQDQDPAKLAENQIMFDIDAIRKEVANMAVESKEYNASAEFEIKEIKSTLPPMKIDIATIPPGSSSNSNNTSSSNNPHSKLRETKSYNDSLGASSSTSKSGSNGTHTTAGGWEEYDEFEHEQEHMEMTFDTSFRDPAPHSLAPHTSSYALNSNTNTATNTVKSPLPLSPLPAQPARSDVSSPWDDDPHGMAAARPPLRSAKTDGPGLGSSSVRLEPPPDLGHNAWADEFEDDFGTEKEVQMSFM
jgi:hypothetical protein